MPPSRDRLKPTRDQRKPGGTHYKRKTYKGPDSDAPVRAKPYTKLNVNGGLDPKARPAAASRTASRLSALGLSSIGSTPTSASPHPASPDAAPPRPPSKAQMATMRAKDEELREELDNDLGNVVQALNERAAEGNKKAGKRSKAKADRAKKVETEQKDFEKMEMDMDATVDMLGSL
ncbi:hypothetical protein HKX48_006401 [Thoreauomyces humboldtii]|nr:hypothetical protein HKX48_006401 [Thoreauomyces humboldtii]